MYFLLFLSSSDLSLPYNLPRATVILSFSWPPTHCHTSHLGYSLTKKKTSLVYCLYRTGFLSDWLSYRTGFLYWLWNITWHVLLGVLSCALPAFFILLLLYFLSFLLFLVFVHCVPMTLIFVSWIFTLCSFSTTSCLSGNSFSAGGLL